MDYFMFYSKKISFKVIYLKRNVLPIVSLLFVLCLVFFSNTAVNSASRGIQLWLYVVFPSLFPFFVASEILGKTGFVRVIGIMLEPVMRPLFNVPGCASFTFLMGAISGYPVGAKITAEMRKQNMLSRIEAERLLTFSNNSGPLFIIGSVSVGILKMPQLGLFLLLCHIASSITVGLVFRFYKTKNIPTCSTTIKKRSNTFKKLKNEIIQSISKSALSSGEILKNAIKNSITSILIIGGFIILFSVIIDLLLKIGIIDFISSIFSVILSPMNIDRKIITATIGGFFEITTGTNMAGSAGNIPIIQRLAAISMMLGWAGLSVHSQVLSIISSTDISIKPYLLGKFIHGTIALVFTLAGFKIAGAYLLDSKPAFSQLLIPQNITWQGYFFTSCKYILFILLILIIISISALIINSIAKKLFKLWNLGLMKK